MGSTPKIPDPAPPPAAPPPPTPTVKRLADPTLSKKRESKKKGTSSLTIRRPSVSVGSSGTGANV